MSIDRSRRVIFEQMADEYAASRASLPPEWVEDILQLSQLPPDGHILEIGCGPGNVTVLFAQRGYPVLGIELGERLAHYARQRCQPYPNAVIVRSAFEDYDLPPAHFNLALSADAFHWIVPEIGYPKLVRALKPGGSIALSFHVAVDPGTDWSRAIDDRFRQLAPHCETPHQSHTFAWLEGVIRGNFREILGIEAVTVREYHWSEPASGEKYAQMVMARSHYFELPGEVRQRLFAEVQQIIQAAGDRVEVPYQVALFHVRM